MILNPSPEAPSIPSIPDQVAYTGLPFRYDVNASGVGAPNYSLSSPPAGMTINSKTGIIDWPNPIGSSVNVTVTATHPTLFTNSNKSFTINISNPPFLPANMISYWRMDETGSPDAFVDLPGVNDAKCNDCPEVTQGIVDGALFFNGNKKVDVIDDSSLYIDFSESFTLEMWVKPNQSGQQSFIGKWTDPRNTFYSLGMNSQNKPKFELNDFTYNIDPYKDATSSSVTGKTVLNDGSWHHIAGLFWRRSGLSDELRLYVDGNLDSTVKKELPSDFFSWEPLTIGYYKNGNFYYNGLMDEVAIYNTRVEGFKVARHYISGLARKGYSDNYVLVSLKAYLQGPYNSGIGLMDTTLKATNLIPKTIHPYTSTPWNYDGLERVVSYPDSVVDWVFVELRDPVTPSTIISKRAVFIKKNGNLVEIDPKNATGLSPADSTQLNYIIFPEVSPGNYYIVIKHRNHLAIMSAAPVALSKASTLYNFTDAQSKAYPIGGNPMVSLGGSPEKFGMIAGDANGDGGVYAEDYTLYKLGQGNEGYKLEDLNLDGGVYAEDYTIYKLNQGKETSVP